MNESVYRTVVEIIGPQYIEVITYFFRGHVSIRFAIMLYPVGGLLEPSLYISIGFQIFGPNFERSHAHAESSLRMHDITWYVAPVQKFM